MSEYIVELNDSPTIAVDGWNVRCDDLMIQHEEIVRCRDCVRFVPKGTYRYNSGVTNTATCDVIRGFVVQIDPDGFCAWGEREGNA